MEIVSNPNLRGMRADHQMGDQVHEKHWKSSNKLEESDSTLSTCCVDDIDEDEEFQPEGSSATLATTMEEECTTSDRRVRFGTVELRVYPMTLGDNPSCSYGPPVSCDDGTVINPTSITACLLAC
jgi:hypothetical protein